MIKKYANLLLGIGLALAIGVPLGLSQFFGHGNSSSVAAPANPQTGVTQPTRYEPAAPPLQAIAGTSGPETPASPTTQPSSVHVQDPRSVFDFQVTPEWIVAHWPAVATGLSQLQLEGYRVPLVTGTARHDMAGSLTYYFNADQKLQKITFSGTTGDPKPLIGLLTTRFHLTRRLVNDPGLVVYEAVHHDNQPASSLKIRLAPLAQPNDLCRFYNVELTLDRPE